MLFSEPKIPQIRQQSDCRSAPQRFQCSSASRKFLKRSNTRRKKLRVIVSVLFSEPKIPQNPRMTICVTIWTAFQCSSASRKFLKAATAYLADTEGEVSVLFSEPKIPQTPIHQRARNQRRGFSALQRAENSSNQYPPLPIVAVAPFQCSSASRKFLKNSRVRHIRLLTRVSVLFSEPKIPQRNSSSTRLRCGTGFSALQRAENSSNLVIVDEIEQVLSFSALQRAENSSNVRDVIFALRK